MIIEKNMNIKIDLNSDLVSEYFKKCLDNTTELSDIVDKLDTNVLSYIAAYYVGKINRENPEQYAKFKQFLPKSIDEEMTMTNEETSNNGTDLIVNIGDTVFIQSRHTSPAYVLLVAGHDTFDKWEVDDIKKSKTDDYMIMLRSDCKLGIRMMYEDLKHLFAKKELYIVKH